MNAMFGIELSAPLQGLNRSAAPNPRALPWAGVERPFGALGLLFWGLVFPFETLGMPCLEACFEERP